MKVIFLMLSLLLLFCFISANELENLSNLKIKHTLQRNENEELTGFRICLLNKCDYDIYIYRNIEEIFANNIRVNNNGFEIILNEYSYHFDSLYFYPLRKIAKKDSIVIDIFLSPDYFYAKNDLSLIIKFPFIKYDTDINDELFLLLQDNHEGIGFERRKFLLLLYNMEEALYSEVIK